MRRVGRKLWLTILLSSGLSVWADIDALGANDACTAPSGSTLYQCSGNQSLGVSWNGSSGSGETVPAQATQITITNLSSNITGVHTLSGLTGAVLASVPTGSTAPFSLIFNDPSHAISLASPTAAGITVSAPDQTEFYYGNNPPIAGPNLPLTVTGVIQAGGPTLPAISLTSAGHNAEKGGEWGFYGRPVSLTLVGVALPAGEPQVLMTAAYPGNNVPATPAVLASTIGGGRGTRAGG